MNAKKSVAVRFGSAVWFICLATTSMARERESSEQGTGMESRTLPGDNLIKNPWFRKGNQPH